jgi:hypothetical protein
MVYLSAYDVSSGATKQAYLNRAKACGDWLIKSGLWDNVAEGGFWWSTQKHKSQLNQMVYVYNFSCGCMSLQEKWYIKIGLYK